MNTTYNAVSRVPTGELYKPPKPVVKPAEPQAHAFIDGELAVGPFRGRFGLVRVPLRV